MVDIYFFLELTSEAYCVSERIVAQVYIVVGNIDNLQTKFKIICILFVHLFIYSGDYSAMHY